MLFGGKMDFKGMEKNRNKEICKEIHSVFWIRNDGSLDEAGGTGDKWTDSGYIVRALSIGLDGRWI